MVSRSGGAAQRCERARTSVANRSGSSHAAKWPPLSASGDDDRPTHPASTYRVPVASSPADESAAPTGPLPAAEGCVSHGSGEAVPSGVAYHSGWLTDRRPREGPMSQDSVPPWDDVEDEGVLDRADTLDDDAVEDPLDAGIEPADRWSGANRFGTTAAEQRAGESLDQLLAEEAPDVDPYANRAEDEDDLIRARLRERAEIGPPGGRRPEWRRRRVHRPGHRGRRRWLGRRHRRRRRERRGGSGAPGRRPGRTG